MSQLPSWATDIAISLPLHPQLLLTGNVRDLYPVASADIETTDSGAASELLDVVDIIWRICRERGYACLVSVDTTSGRIEKRANDEVPQPTFLDQLANDGMNTESLESLMDTIVRNRERAVALVIPYAARIAHTSLSLSTADVRLLARAESLGDSAEPVAGGPDDSITTYNTIFWVCTRQEELHPAFPLGSPALRVIPIPQPTLDTRTQAALLFADDADGVRGLADATPGMTIREMQACVRLSKDLSLTNDRYTEAARLLRVGTNNDRWTIGALRAKIGDAEAYLGQRVIGQSGAVAKAVDVLVRSAVGLNGAHVASSPNRPRGVLFLSGPTGVGKTELAKGIASLVLGEGAEPVRFDMSEFRADYARQRLIGAPPGYVGYDAGGELTNAVRQNPVCVLLFDEIEKANDRIFDLFLQILEDGRLTDGRGTTVHFTECFIVFTSNLGTVPLPPIEGQVAIEPITYDTPADQVEATLKAAYVRFFDSKLGRPELRNRLGDSFVALGFLDKQHFPLLLSRALDKVKERVTKTVGASLDISSGVEALLLGKIGDHPENGARGIGTIVESMVVNPLSRWIFEQKALGAGDHINLLTLTASAHRWEAKAEVWRA